MINELKYVNRLNTCNKKKTKTNGRQKVRGGPGKVKGANVEKSLSCM